VAAEPASDALEAAIRTALTGALVDRLDDRVRALVRVPRAGATAVQEALVRALGPVPGARAGVSDPCASPVAYAEAFDESAHALVATSLAGSPAPVARFGELGPYRYLLRIAEHAGARDETVERVQRLAAYDGERSTQLLTTLEEFLHRHGSIAATAEALFVHQNTLRQRLRRIADVADLDLRTEDWLTLEIAVKLVRIRDATG
ncbi:MAG: PucR family transcriptional regulator, partial [Gaiella sp.]